MKSTYKKKIERRNKTYKRSNHKRSNYKRSNHKRSNHKRNKKTRKLIKKGGDIMYLSEKGADKMFGLDQTPTRNLICSDYNKEGDKSCLAFGDVADHVAAFFNGFIGAASGNNFVEFNFARKDIRQIGKPSENGFVFEITNKTNGYTAYSVLKSAQETTSDNLMYEYNVGLYLNAINKFYPCFLETYGLFKYKSEREWKLFKESKKIFKLSALQEALDLQPLDYAVGCPESKHLAILIQHLPRPNTLEDLLDDTIFLNNELIGALFQLYVPLARLMRNFTHYDLHLGNVLIYEPAVDKYIEYHYHNTPTIDSSTYFANTARKTQTAHVASMQLNTISFKSSYIVKIIDYGRSYFYEDERNNAKTVYDEICKTAQCTDSGEIECGASYGLSWLEDNSADPEGSHYISTQKSNISHDLLPLDRIYKTMLKDTALREQLPPGLYEDLLGKVMYEWAYGTYEDRATGYREKTINNVQDAAIVITDFVKNRDYMAHNRAVNMRKTKLGDLHIYMDGSQPMEFIPSAP